MTTKNGRALQRQLVTLFHQGAVRELTDGQLLERFATGRDEAAEEAFAGLVERHGPMVLRVCRAQLSDIHDTQDAFQATFLILVQKARGLWVHDSLGPWLHQVALRTASCARATSARRRRLDREAAAGRPERFEDPDRTMAERERVLHDEINRLPDRYRIPIVLCDLEGRSCEEAARRMGRPVGTIKCWRARGRERLRMRLTRSGFAPAIALAVPSAGQFARADGIGLASEKFVRIATRALTEGTTAGAVSASTRALVKGVSRAMFMGKLRSTACLVVALTALAAGVAGVTRVSAEGEKSAPQAARSEPPAKVPPLAKSLEGKPRPMTLREAIRIGLENARDVRVIRFTETEALVAPAADDFDDAQFRADVMARLRVIEETYWSLAQQHDQLRACERAVALARSALKREKDSSLEPGQKTANVAEAEQRFEHFSLDLMARTADAMITEGQLRERLGLPPADGQRIIPATPPTEARVEPDWDASLKTMMENQPDLVRARFLAKRAEAALNTGFTPTPLNATAGNSEKTPSRVADLEQERIRANDWEREVTHQITHNLARRFLEVDANYKQFRTAAKRQAGAAQRLEAQTALYDERRIPVERYLDLVSKASGEEAQEAQFRMVYNVAIMRFEEAKGTLLDHDRIAIVGTPRTASTRRTKSFMAWRSDEVARPSPTVPAPPAAVSPAPVESGPKAAKPKQSVVTTAEAGKTISFRFTIGTGEKPIEVRGSLNIGPASAVPPTLPLAAPVDRNPED